MSSDLLVNDSVRPVASPGRPPVVGMVGAGQLALMTHQAAISLGIRLDVMAASKDDPSVKSGARHTVADFHDLDSLRKFAGSCDVLTFDHEQVPPGHIAALEREGFRIAPGSSASLLAQDKSLARRKFAEYGFPVPDFIHASNIEEIESFAEIHGWPIVAKAPSGGYDGRGVWVVGGSQEAAQILENSPDGLLIEPRLDIQTELSVLVARSSQGEILTYPVVETVQEDAMCREIVAPAMIDSRIMAEAKRLSLAIAERIDAVGIMAVEFFLTDTGLLVNELALRPHNSGHYTIEGCSTSQFEQHLRAVLGLPLGLPSLLAPAVVTVNVVGGATDLNPSDRLAQALAVPGAHIHLYGKAPRPGRKLGHVTVCGQDAEPVLAAARLAANVLEGTAS